MTWKELYSETRGKEITFDDLEPQNTSPEDVAYFAADYSSGDAGILKAPEIGSLSQRRQNLFCSQTRRLDVMPW